MEISLKKKLSVLQFGVINMAEWPQEVPDAEMQSKEIETQRKDIRKQMRKTDEQTQMLLDNDYFLFFGEANK